MSVHEEPEHLIFTQIEREGWRAFWAGYGHRTGGEAFVRGWWMANARAYGEGVRAALQAPNAEGANPYRQFSPAGESWASGFDETRADMPPAEPRTREQVIEAALNVAVAHIQEALGEETGDFAALWFDGPEESTVLSVLGRYYDAQARFGRTPAR